MEFLALAAEGGVWGGESSLGNLLEDNFHSSFCLFFLAVSPSVVPSISTSSKVRRALKSAKASMATVTMPSAIIWARCAREAKVVEGRITDMSLGEQQKLEGSVR